MFLRNRAYCSIFQNLDFCPLTVAFDLFNPYRRVLERSDVVRGDVESESEDEWTDCEEHECTDLEEENRQEQER